MCSAYNLQFGKKYILSENVLKDSWVKTVLCSKHQSSVKGNSPGGVLLSNWWVWNKKPGRHNNLLSCPSFWKRAQRSSHLEFPLKSQKQACKWGDQQFWELLVTSNFCVVLTWTQLGKGKKKKNTLHSCRGMCQWISLLPSSKPLPSSDVANILIFCLPEIFISLSPQLFKNTGKKKKILYCVFSNADKT